jgi:hypothetical protein
MRKQMMQWAKLLRPSNSRAMLRPSPGCQIFNSRKARLRSIVFNGAIGEGTSKKIIFFVWTKPRNEENFFKTPSRILRIPFQTKRKQSNPRNHSIIIIIIIIIAYYRVAPPVFILHMSPSCR